MGSEMIVKHVELNRVPYEGSFIAYGIDSDGLRGRIGVVWRRSDQFAYTDDEFGSTLLNGLISVCTIEKCIIKFRKDAYSARQIEKLELNN